MVYGNILTQKCKCKNYMLNIQNLDFSFPNKRIFKGLNVEINSGYVTGIVGKNGIGKTTFFRLLTGIYTPDKGSILHDGEKLIHQSITIMSTEPYFYPYMTGEEYLNIVALDKNELKNSTSFCAAFELPLEQMIDRYSTGMRKKLAFSAIISQNKPIIILDEPYNGVDLEGNEIMKYIIHKTAHSKTILLSSHVLSTVTDVSEKVYYFGDKFEVLNYEKGDFSNLQKMLSDQMYNKIHLHSI